MYLNFKIDQFHFFVPENMKHEKQTLIQIKTYLIFFIPMSGHETCLCVYYARWGAEGRRKKEEKKAPMMQI